ncbi:MAG: MCE family protein [Myxococcales bacterium]|nr:MCE family protein [Myxococcales bacterium]
MALKREIKVGVFVLVGMFVFGLVIFLIGDERQAFERKESYSAIFEDVQGLKRGSTVRMGGFDVGAVTDVRYSDDPDDLKLYVGFTVVKREARRIRGDSFVTIDNKGLLGDKMITLKAGSPGTERIPPGGVVPTKPAKDIGEMMGQIGNISAKAETVMGNLEKTTGAMSEEKFTSDVQGSVRSLNNILKSLDEGNGYAAKLLKDPAEAERLSRTLSNMEKATVELNQTLRGVNAIVGRVQTGPGFAHDVLYGDAPTKTVASFGNAADELALTLKGIREGNGPAKSLIYGDDKSQELMGNINAMSRDLRQIVAGVRAGKGTVGALLVDPSVYEDIKMVLGNVDRNKAVRALVRYSIKQDETKPKVEVKDPGAAAAKPAAPNDATAAQKE